MTMMYDSVTITMQLTHMYVFSSCGECIGRRPVKGRVEMLRTILGRR